MPAALVTASWVQQNLHRITRRIQVTKAFPSDYDIFIIHSIIANLPEYAAYPFYQLRPPFQQEQTEAGIHNHVTAEFYQRADE